MSLSLVYLSYIPFGKSYLQSFLTSYKEKQPGTPHSLVILFNGHSSEEEAAPFIDLLQESGVQYDYLFSPEKFDIASYFHVAGVLTTEYIGFVNTYSVILHDNWLNHLYLVATRPDVGCVSGTGSWGDFAHNDEYRNLCKKAARLQLTLTGIKKMIFFRFNFYPRVTAHVRTNAFVIKRSVFLNLSFLPVKPAILNAFFNISGSKLKSLCFEHGNNSLTNQILRMGLKTLLVDCKGGSYDIEQWKEAKTFWTADQENLLVSDNQTQKYQLADASSRKQLTYAAWGKLEQ